MAATEVDTVRRPIEELDHTPRKRFKTSELPLTSSQRSTVDSLLHTIKKKGEYDILRKRVWAQYEESRSSNGWLSTQPLQEDKATFINSLNDLAENEIDRDPSLLSRERGKAATLMQGAVDRSNIYKSVEASLDGLIAEHLGHVEAVAREIRRKEVGEEAAAEEEKRGNKPDEEYAREAIVRREARQKQREKDEARRRREEEVEKLRQEEAKKKAELEKLRRADERRREHRAKEEKRAKDREAHRALLKQNEREQELRREERRKEASQRREARDRSSDRLHVRRGSEGTPRSQEQARQESRTPTAEKSATPPPASPVDEKALEAAALDLLLREGRELAAKSGSRIEKDRSPSIEPPSLRKSQSVKPPKLGEISPPKGPSADRSRSPKKPIIIPTGPKFSFNQTRRPLDSPRPAPAPRSRSPSHAPDRRESVDGPHRSYESDPKSAWKSHASSKYEVEKEDYRRSSRSYDNRDEERRSYHESRPTSSHRRDHDQERDYERDRDRDKDRKSYRQYDDEKYHSSRDYEYAKEGKYRISRDYDNGKDEYQSSHHRSRDRDTGHNSTYDRDRERDRDRDRDGGHDRDRHRERRYSRSERSRSGERSTHHRSTGATGYIEIRSSRYGDRPRPKSPVEIDRYVPSTSSRAKELEPRNFRDRDRDKTGLDGAEDVGKERERERYNEKERHSDRGRVREREEERERYNERERDREKERYSDRERERYSDKDRYAERDRYADREREKKSFVEIDRYVPGGGDRRRDRDRDKERERDRERERGRDRS